MTREHEPSESLDKHARDEAWLRDELNALDGDASPDRAMLQEQVRIALHESWLADQVVDEIPEELGKNVKRRIRGVLAEVPASSAYRRQRWRRWAGGLAIAAAACLAVFVFPDFLAGDADGQETAWLASYSFRQDDLLISLEELDQDLEALELSLGGATSSEPMDDLMDDLMFEVEDLLTEEEWG